MGEQQYEQKIPIVVFGTDAKGDMFQEDTATLVVAATWAKIRLRHAMAPGGEAIIFNKDNGNQAEFVARESAPGEATLALRDHSIDIWQLDFGEQAAPLEEGTDEHIECSGCHTRECVRLNDDQLDQLMGAGKLKRYCTRCMADTDWEEDSVVDARHQLGTTAEASASAQGASVAPPAATPPVPPTAEAPAAAAPAAPKPAAEVSVTDQILRAGRDAPERRTAKRLAIKTRARVRRVGSSEVVEPINVSRGGICFPSRLSYELDEIVWVATNYIEGDKNPIETPSRVVRITRSGPGQLPAYGLSFQI